MRRFKKENVCTQVGECPDSPKSFFETMVKARIGPRHDEHVRTLLPRIHRSAAREDAWLLGVPEQGLPAVDGALTIGLPTEYYSNLGIADQLAEVRRILEALGHTCKEVSLPHTDAAIPAYYVIAGAEASTNLSRYDGVRFGHRCENPESLQDLYERSRSEGVLRGGALSTPTRAPLRGRTTQASRP